MKKFDFKTSCSTFKNCHFEIMKYDNGRIYFDISKRGETIADCTVWLKNTESNTNEDQAYITQDVLDFLKGMGIVKEVLYYHPSGFTSFPLCIIDLELLKEYGKVLEEE